VKQPSIRRELLVIAFVVYLVVVAALTVIPTHVSRLRSPHADHVNLIPLRYSLNCILLAHRRHPDLMTFCLRNTFGNVALFLPLGILLPWSFAGCRSIKRTVLLAFCLSLTIETIQFLSRFIGSPRAVDIDDVLLNTLGACLGFLVYRYVIQKHVTVNGLATSDVSAETP
jgi:glycopeptide antibiotics resistance protein